MPRTGEAPPQTEVNGARPRAADRPAAAGPKADELLDLLRQERADFRNYRQRITDERAAEVERLRAGLLEPLLPLIDDLDRALDEVPKHLVDEPWVRGIGITRSKLGQLQEWLGLERIGDVGDRFDPARHDAVVYEPDPEASEARIGQIIRPGYVVGERLLRPAQVVVRGPLLNADSTTDSGTPEIPDTTPEPTGE
jgi:molecular chaperone GrpE